MKNAKKTLLALERTFSKVKIVVCIPARYASTRFPGKVLAADTGKFLIQHTWEQAKKANLPDKVLIAADHQKIKTAAESFGAECILTSKSHHSGTDRIAEALRNIPVDIVVNFQADEPEINPALIDKLAKLLLDNPHTPMATIAVPFENASDIENPDIVKVVTDTTSRAVYFSRAPIPYHRQKAGIGPAELYLHHLGMYAYRKNFLLKLTSLPQTPLEKIEKLEQLRALENGFNILVATADSAAPGIDTPAQYAEFVRRYKKRQKTK